MARRRSTPLPPRLPASSQRSRWTTSGLALVHGRKKKGFGQQVIEVRPSNGDRPRIQHRHGNKLLRKENFQDRVKKKRMFFLLLFTASVLRDQKLSRKIK